MITTSAQAVNIQRADALEDRKTNVFSDASSSIPYGYKSFSLSVPAFVTIRNVLTTYLATTGKGARKRLFLFPILAPSSATSSRCRGHGGWPTDCRRRRFRHNGTFARGRYGCCHHGLLVCGVVSRCVYEGSAAYGACGGGGKDRGKGKSGGKEVEGVEGGKQHRLTASAPGSAFT